MKQEKYHIICPVCGNYEFYFLELMTISRWETGEQLCAEEREAELLTCQVCGHHQMNPERYDQEFFEFLYPNNAIPESIRNSPGLYQDIIEYNREYLSGKKELNVVDLGGGAGDFLQSLINAPDLKARFNKLGVYDFKQRKSVAERIAMFRLDFNNIGPSFLESLESSELDYAFCIHVLEHLLNPRDFLSNIQGIDREFYLYLEVPSSKKLSIESSISVVHPTHVHYFTLENLVWLLKDVGFSVLKAEACITGGVPRLKLLAQKRFTQENKILRLRQDERARWEFLYNLVIKETQTRRLFLWGLGQEFRDLVRLYPQVAQLIDDQKIGLVDTGFKGRNFGRAVIIAPEDLLTEESGFKVVIMPKLARTRGLIKNHAQKIGLSALDIVDPCLQYVSSRLTVDR